MKAIRGFAGYYVTNDGEVWSEKRHRLKQLRAATNSRGYKYVVLYRKGEKKCCRIHRLVLEAFRGLCPKGMEACHKNGIHSDNRIGNLYWGTHQQNMDDARKHGVMWSPSGEDCYATKVTNDQAEAIREIGQQGVSIRLLARATGISESQVSQLVKGRRG